MADTVKAIPELSVDTRVLIERLKTVNVGDIVPYAELTALIGRDVQGQARYVLDGAKRKLEREDHIVFEAVMDVGVKRLTSSEVVGTGEHAIKRIRRASSRAAFRQSIVPLEELDDATKTRSLTFQSWFGVLKHMTRPTVVKAIETRCTSAMPTAKMIEEIAKTL